MNGWQFTGERRLVGSESTEEAKENVLIESRRFPDDVNQYTVCIWKYCCCSKRFLSEKVFFSSSNEIFSENINGWCLSLFYRYIPTQHAHCPCTASSIFLCRNYNVLIITNISWKPSFCVFPKCGARTEQEHMLARQLYNGRNLQFLCHLMHNISIRICHFHFRHRCASIPPPDPVCITNSLYGMHEVYMNRNVYNAFGRLKIVEHFWHYIYFQFQLLVYQNQH